MKQVLIDYYRCPETLADFQVAGKVLEDPGYFCFGPETICYGRLTSGSTSKRITGHLYDALPDVRPEVGAVRLPMNPNEVIENLRHERYHRNGTDSRSPLSEDPKIRTLYYQHLRPFLPLPLRKRLQRLYLRDWRNIPFPRWPVDRTVDQILERLLSLSMKAQGIARVPFIWFWPDGATSSAIITHDVEHLAGRNFCSELMDLDDSVGIKSSFQIVPEERYPVSREFLENIRTRGFEINIHDLNHDGQLFSNHGEFLRRAERINEYGRNYRALGFRSGGLQRNLDWYAALEFSYDMSVPSTGRLEVQGGGCCSLMPFFIGRILELPLTTTQDYTLFHILNDYSINLWKQQLDAITERHGLASFIVHPDYVIEKRARTAYQDLLKHLAHMREERNTWIALPGEVHRWWRLRSQMNLVYDGNRWRIEGMGKERARLAFATLLGDKLAFTVQHN